MTEFINTIELLGDDAVIDSIIDRSITEFMDDAITTIAPYAFYECTNLRRVRVPSVTGSISANAFSMCRNLYLLDFAGDLNKSNIVNGCTSLRAIALRGNSVGVLSATSGITTTPIATGTGHIYARRALIDSYKEATNWSAYASQFRALEDYTVDGTVTGELDETKI